MDDKSKPINFLDNPREWLINRLGGVSPLDISTQIENIRRRAFESGMEAAELFDDEPHLTDASGKPIALGYRDKSRPKRDLSSISQEKAIEASYRIWQTNPLGKALTEIMVDYVVGEGIQIICNNDDVRTVIEDFLEDDVNRLNETGFQEITRELSLFGEQIILMFVRYGNEKVKGDGRVRYGTADPSQIHSIITHPDNYRDVYAIRMKSDSMGEQGPLYMVIREDIISKQNKLEGYIDLKRYTESIELLNSPDNHSDPAKKLELKEFIRTVPKGAKEYLVNQNDSGNLRRNLEEVESSNLDNLQYDGQCFLVQVNKLSTGTRGRPDLLPMLDWIDQLDNVFFDGVDHIQLLNLFSWDLTIEGGSSDDPDPDRNLAIQSAKVTKLRSKSVYSHNEYVTLEAKNPSLQSAELETLARALRIFIAGGARIPEHWLAEGGYTNRATAEEMGQPTYKMLVSRQRVIRHLFIRIIRFVIDTAVLMGELSETVDVEDNKGRKETLPAREAFNIVMPEIDVADTTSVSGSLLRIMQAVITGIAAKVISREIGMEVIARILKMLGVETDVAEMEEDIIETSGEASLPSNIPPNLVELIKNYATELEDEAKAKAEAPKPEEE